MKNEWRANKLGEVCSFLNRGVSPKYLGAGGICVLNQKCVRDHQVSYEPSRRHDVQAKKVGSERLIQVGDVLVNSTGTGTLGRIAQVRESPPEPTTVDSHVTIVRPSPGKFYPEFFGYMLMVIEDAIKEAGEGCGGQTELARSVLADKFSVHYPVLLSEQQRIVGILNEAFDGIATAKANAEQNLQNARALFESHLQAVFTQRGEGWIGNTIDRQATRKGELPVAQTQDETYSVSKSDSSDYGGVNVTKTGGRDATLRHIPGRFALAVGMPKTPPRKGWRWTSLTDLAQLESGHTPSRRHPEYWGGSISWIGIQDARECHGRQIDDTFQHTNALGISNSSARVLPAKTVCLSRTASVGYVVVMGRPMATSQDFVNWVCSSQLKPDFLKYIFLAEGRDLLRFASGAVHQTIYFPEAKAFHVCHPGLAEQAHIIAQLDSLREDTQRLESLYQQKLAALDALKKSLLHQAFTGKL